MIKNFAAPRYKVSLHSSVLITAVQNSVAGAEQYFVLNGQLLDVSVSGLAIIISGGDLLELQKLGAETKLILMLPLPLQAIELEAVPVRYQKLKGGRAGRILLGAQITNMKGRDRILFMDFINQCDAVNLRRVSDKNFQNDSPPNKSAQTDPGAQRDLLKSD